MMIFPEEERFCTCQCSLCYGLMNRHDMCAQTECCGNIFHYECLRLWQEDHYYLCPSCRDCERDHFARKREEAIQKFLVDRCDALYWTVNMGFYDLPIYP